ncbi:MAG TPA: sigma-70 family RNA polymerase sigma factor [Dehalococcoidia bacterium]|nr:sigma-70 family RNA polymerase sigma factor [Dehalococcoidia bacterium]
MQEVNIENHIRLVHWMSRKYSWSDAEYEELVSSGMEGLLVAKERFDPSKGYKFVTYATWWVRSYVQKAVNSHIKENHQSLNQEDKLGRMAIDKVVAIEADTQIDMTPAITLLLATLAPRERLILGRKFGFDNSIHTEGREAAVHEARNTLKKLKRNV